MKQTLSTRLDDDVVKRLERVAEADYTDVSTILRKSVMRQLPVLEREILGAEFAGQPVKKDEVAA